MKRLEPYLYGAGIGVLVAVLSSAAPAQQQSTPDYTITLNGQDWYQIGEALSAMPFKIANPILTKMNQQLAAEAVKRQAEEKAKGEADKKPE